MTDRRSRPTPPARMANPPAVKHPVTTPLPATTSAAYHLFTDRYACTTAQRNLYSANYLKISGVVSTGDKTVDKAMGDYPVAVWLTPVAMAEFRNDGASFTLNNPADAAPIYKHLRDHLMDWKNHIDRNININDPPMEDLRKLEELAQEMYPIALGYMPVEEPSFGFLGRNFGVMRGLSREAPILPKNDPTADPNVTPVDAPYVARPHAPVFDSIVRALADRTAPTKKDKPWEKK